MISRLLRFLIGLLLLPVCVAVTQTLAGLLQSLSSSPWLLPPAALAFLAGYAIWLTVFLALPRPVRTYVLAHELTHALWGAVMGARVTKMKVSREGGSVTLSKTNFMITLAPYFFPLYTVLVIAVYVTLLPFLDVQRWYLLWIGLVGLTWGFHLTFTVTTLLTRQTDIHECGRLFSYTLIYILNALGLSLWIVAVSSATVGQMAGLLFGQAVQGYVVCGRAVASFALWFHNKAAFRTL
jgi:hypothetical protein